jgi:hypothetical protein
MAEAAIRVPQSMAEAAIKVPQGMNDTQKLGEVLRLLGIWRGASFAMCDSATGLAAQQRSTPWRRDYLLHSTPVKS